MINAVIFGGTALVGKYAPKALTKGVERIWGGKKPVVVANHGSASHASISEQIPSSSPALKQAPKTATPAFKIEDKFTIMVDGVPQPIKVITGEEAGIVWAQGSKAAKDIKKQGLPWETYLENTYPAGSRLPPNFKTFDFYDKASGVAVSAKTINNLAPTYLANPAQIYSKAKSHVDATIHFERHELLNTPVTRSQITSRIVHYAIPESTTPEQFKQYQRVVDYGRSKGVVVKITRVTK